MRDGWLPGDAYVAWCSTCARTSTPGRAKGAGWPSHPRGTNVHVAAGNRDGLEQLVRYVLKPPIRVFPAFASWRCDAAQVRRRIPMRAAHMCGFFLTLAPSEVYA
jgi:hypothetical protein